MTLHPQSPLMNHCPETLPSAAYLSPEWFAREQRGIWAREWVYVGRLGDLKPGTMRRVALAGENLILVRAPDGKVTAFHNTCRHRGAELCSEAERAVGRLITCPYHAWSYATDGRLISTAHATPTADFRKEENGLYAVALREWNGFLFLCLADNPPEFKPDLGVHALDNWPMADLVTGHRLEKVLDCNWKVFWENYNECLHCPGIHPELSDMVPIYKKGIMSEQEAPDWTPEHEHHGTLKEGALTWSIDGKPCGPEFPNLTAQERANGHNFVTLYPTMFIVAHVDYVRAVSLMPIGPEQTRLTAEWMFPAETLAQPGFDMAHVTDFATIVLMQDGAACEMNQRGLRSSRHARGRLMPQEFDIHRFHQWVLSRIEAPEVQP
ncbi:MAG: ring-hydroxylating oxygenase subunit alpha [Cereibacter sphaeroides]|uniref:Ring-hydroxylating oxygenase subunit alpha n=1 Tax=Cereibacter sphaeroides TaxID=1063 RepID=A0A2W5TXD1_CERSP|nr:MAG: ring-hydroxylating oxygenase subunit alpha [Cereibacter sphaeroides]